MTDRVSNSKGITSRVVFESEEDDDEEFEFELTIYDCDARFWDLCLSLHMSAFASEEEEAGAFVDISWNGEVVEDD